MQHIEMTIKKDHLKVEGTLFRKYMESVTVVNFLNGMVDMIPDEKGLSVLKTGLSFIFQVPSLAPYDHIRLATLIH